MDAVLLFQLVAAPLLVFAAARDIATRLIPDGVSIAIVLAGVSSRLMVGWSEAGTSLAFGVILFIVLLPLAMRGWFGGGDVKLIAAMATGRSPCIRKRRLPAEIALAARSSTAGPSRPSPVSIR